MKRLLRADRATIGLLAAIGFSVAGRVVNLFATLVIVRISVGALGIEQYGVLSTVVALTTFFAFGDLGLGLTLMNRIAFAQGRGERAAMRPAIATVLALVTGLSAALLLVALAVYGLLRAGGATGCTGAGPCLSDGTILAVIALALATVPLSLPIRILLGLQQGVASQAWMTAGRLATIAAVFGASLVSTTPGPFAIAMVAAPLAVALANTLWFFAVSHPDLRPRRADVDRREAWTDLRAGGGMALLQLVTFADIGFDTILALHFFGAAQAGTLDVVSKLFLYLPALISVGLTPVWPALAAAHAAGDRRRSRRILVACYAAIAVLSTGAGLVLVLFLPQISRLWLGVSVAVDPVIPWSFLVWGLCVSITSVQSIAMNARNVVGPQLPLAVGFVLATLALKLAFASSGYLPGIPLALALLYPARIVLFHLLVVRRHAPG